MIIRMNPGKFYFPRGMFWPIGKKNIHGRKSDFKKNPRNWESDPGEEREKLLSARIIVGLDVRHPDTLEKLKEYEVSDVVRIVKRVRTQQTGDPGASFISQKGLYKHKEKDVIIDEKGVQILILSLFGGLERTFKNNIENLAEIIAQKLQQEEVIVEFQEDGLTIESFGITGYQDG